MTNEKLEAEIERCGNMIHALADRWVEEYRQLEREDVVQEIKLAFVMSNKTYCPEAGTKFSTYALQRAQWHVLEYARGQLSRGVHIPSTLDPIILDMEDLNGVVVEDGTQLHETIAAPGHEHEPVIGEELWDKIKLVLTNRQYEVMELAYLDDLDAGEIAERLGVSEEHVTDLALEARNRIRDFMPHLGALIQRRAAS